MPSRPEFREWVDQLADPGWTLLPLTHVTAGLTAKDIIREGLIAPGHCAVFGESLAYFFYGRPAYRLADEGTIRIEAACPYCFIFAPNLIRSAKAIYAFDTGAFSKRMYKHAFVEEMGLDDFSLEADSTRLSKLIGRAFPSLRTYFDGDLSKATLPEKGARPGEFHARAYLELLSSKGRNELDDRICSIEVVFGTPVHLDGNLLAAVVPHTLWDETEKTPWLVALQKKGVEILPYLFVPGRHPEHYHSQMEAAVREFYLHQGLL